MPRSTKETLAAGDEFADRFETHEPVGENIADATALRALRRAVEDRAIAERHVVDAVSIARAEGHSWAAIAVMLGTSAETARQRYSGPSKQRLADAVRASTPTTNT